MNNTAQRLVDRLFPTRTFSQRATAEAKAWIDTLKQTAPMPEDLAGLPERTNMEIWRKLRALRVHRYWRTIPNDRPGYLRDQANQQIRILLEGAGAF